jgi:hypothetical protein
MRLMFTVVMFASVILPYGLAVAAEGDSAADTTKPAVIEFEIKEVKPPLDTTKPAAPAGEVKELKPVRAPDSLIKRPPRVEQEPEPPTEIPEHVSTKVETLVLPPEIFGPFMDEMMFCATVEEEKPVGADTVFPSTVGKISCWTQVAYAGKSQKVKHVWFHGKEKVGETELDVEGDVSRVWSSMDIPKDGKGEWRVIVYDAQGNILESKTFIIK